MAGVHDRTNLLPIGSNEEVRRSIGMKKLAVLNNDNLVLTPGPVIPPARDGLSNVVVTLPTKGHTEGTGGALDA